jgi:hypothetical protein
MAKANHDPAMTRHVPSGRSTVRGSPVTLNDEPSTWRPRRASSFV